MAALRCWFRLVNEALKNLCEHMSCVDGGYIFELNNLQREDTYDLDGMTVIIRN